MLLRATPPLHLTYCMNVHPGERWPEVRDSIQTHALAIRRAVCPDRPFGLGLRLSRRTLDDLAAPGAMEELRAIMRDHDLYAFTLNGFPYGAFHGQAVKTEVYRPDWTDPARLQYTRDLADTLAALLPEGVDGSISTVPLSYKAWTREPAAEARLFDHLAGIVVHCHRLRERIGREIHIGLEPEPDCTLETTPETVAWFEGPLDREAVPRVAAALACSRQVARAIARRHLGVCFDTCHLAIQYETPADSLRLLAGHGIRISKVQLSAALETEDGPPARERLAAFCDPVYLHQVKTRSAVGAEEGASRCRGDRSERSPCSRGRRPRSSGLTEAGYSERQNVETPPPAAAFPDLPEALASVPATGARWRIHFHVPLYFEGDGVLHSTSSTLDASFWSTLATQPVSHVELETYTFHVLPAALQSGGVANSIVREFEWVRQRLNHQPATIPNHH